MRKILISILCVFIGFSNVAVGENILTTQSFVDSSVAQKQDKIPANNGVTQVLMNTGTPGNVATKDIYDSTGAYGTQTESLVTAEQFNAAVQNAIDTEFVCISWVNDDPNDECLLVDIRGATENQSKNLFDISQINSYESVNGRKLVNNGDGSITVRPISGDSAIGTRKTLSQLAPGLEVGKTYTLSFNTTGIAKYIYLDPPYGSTWRSGASKTITQDMLNSKVAFYGSHPDLTPQTISNIQIEEGDTVTPYQPYGENVYMPSGN